jgi:hypothetical protein
MSTPSRQSESSGREFIAAVRANEAGGKGRIDFEPGANVRASFYLAQKFVDRARAKFMERRREATETEVGGGVTHGAPPFRISPAT